MLYNSVNRDLTHTTVGFINDIEINCKQHIK